MPRHPVHLDGERELYLPQTSNITLLTVPRAKRVSHLLPGGLTQTASPTRYGFPITGRFSGARDQFHKLAGYSYTAYWPVQLTDQLHLLEPCYTNRRLLRSSTFFLPQSASPNGDISPQYHFLKRHGHIENESECPIARRTSETYYCGMLCHCP